MEEGLSSMLSEAEAFDHSQRNAGAGEMALDHSSFPSSCPIIELLWSHFAGLSSLSGWQNHTDSNQVKSRQ